MKKSLLLLLFVIFIAFILPFSSDAAQIFFGVHEKNIGLNSKMEMGVFLNTGGEPINAIEGEIIFPADFFEFQGIYNGNSLLTFWIKQPVLISQGVVSFSGIVPGGFAGPKGYLFSIILKTKQRGESLIISSNNEKILLNDGDGSEAKITKAPMGLNIIEQSPQETFTPLYDSISPESFMPQISKDKNIFDGKYFLAFTTQDKISGIDHYEIMEYPQFGSFKGLFYKKQWIMAESPYLLQDQTLRSVVYIKAVDRAGNERVLKVKTKYFLPLYKNYFFWSTIILMMFISLIKGNLWKKNQF